MGCKARDEVNGRSLHEEPHLPTTAADRPLSLRPEGFDDMRSRTRPRGAAEQRSERTEPPTLHSFAGAGASGGSRLRRCEERLRCPISTRSSRLAYGPISSKRDPQENFNKPLGGDQLAQHIRKNSAVQIIVHLNGRVDTQ